MKFDYATPAELFATASTGGKRRMTYRRFPSAALAIEFAIEGIAPKYLVGAILEVGDERFEHHGIRRLYEAAEYPLPRKEVAA